jgi:hypothetical protein
MFPMNRKPRDRIPVYMSPFLPQPSERGKLR